jgi:mannosyl-oligosaccharide glucosidase
MRVATPPSPQLVPHFGYVSLFPLLMRLLPADSTQLGATLEHLTNSDLLWTEYGLRWGGSRWTYVSVCMHARV